MCASFVWHRKAFLSSLAAGALAACGPVSGGAPLLGGADARAGARRPRGGSYPGYLSSTTLTIDNKSGQKLYWALWGQADSHWLYLTGSNTLEVVPNVTLSSVMFNEFSSSATLDLPYLTGGEIIFSLGAPLQITCTGGSPAAPTAPTLADLAGFIPFVQGEYSFASSGSGPLYIDVSYVDSISVGLSIAATTSGTTQTVGIKNGVSMQRIFDGIAAHECFAPLLMRNGSQVLGVLAPHHGIVEGVFPADYMAHYIQQCWDYIATLQKKGTPLTISYPAGKPGGCVPKWSAGTATCKIVGGMLQFTGTGLTTFSVPQPTTYAAYASNGILTPPYSPSCKLANTVEGAILAILAAAIDRTCLTTVTALPNCGVASYYLRPQTHYYAKVIHEYSYGGLAYAMPYDDDCSQSSTLNPASAPSTVTISVQPYAA